ncbi:acyl-CoA Delta(11) desaturase-like [Anoplophora glabripennis]|uniref:acyl-CoA Delta(11) desaturase-like n=1 Tax=Anoplophora glabripennis TaxID=217634 RepID=UPI0008752987|nr:acyl-CoA Delta(11) desaturase-like [Anoplophora glabripennis]
MPPYTTTLVEEKEIFQKNEEQECTFGREKYKFLIWEFETRIIWTNVILIGLFHFIALYSFLTHSYFEKPGIVIYATVIGSICGFGITGGIHRYFTHRSYKAKLPLKLILIFCFSMSGQNSILEWVRDHRVHHKFSETDADPHDSRRGFFFAHVGWLMMKKRTEVIKKGRQIDYSDLLEDPLVAFHERHFMWFKLICCFILPTIIPPLAWGESWIVSIKALVFARYVMQLNYTWLVNSAAHIYGNKPYDIKICPSENLAVSFVSMGEGYHNYHHTFPWDYRAAEVGSYLNVTTLVLNLFEKIGWAYDMKSTPQELIRKMVENNGDGSHYKWGHEITQDKAKVLMKEL